MPLTSPHPDAAQHADDWRTLRDAYSGSRAIRAGGARYLPKPGGMNDTQYGDYKARGEWYNAAQRTVLGMAGEVFRKDPVVVLPDGFTPPLDNLNGQGLTFIDFAKRVCQEVLHLGHYGVLLDLPADTTPQVRQHPAWAGYPIEQIRSWAFTRVGGHPVLSRLVLDEYVWEAAPDDPYVLTRARHYRLLDLDDGTLRVRQYAEAAGAGPGSGSGAHLVQLGPELRPQRRGVPLDFIPFVLFSATGLEWTLHDAPLLPLVHLNVRHWRHSCDYDHGLHLTALPTLVITGHNTAEDRDEHGNVTTTIVLGSQGGICLPEADAHVSMLEFHGQGLQALEKALETDKREMATMGARLLEEAPQVEERELAVKQRQAGDTSVLRTIASTVSQGLTRCLQWHAWWATATEERQWAAIQVTLNRDFTSSRLASQDLQALVMSWQAGALSWETLHHNLAQGEIMEPGVDAATELARIEAQPAGLGGRLPPETER
jgi:hypothetical protein